jgi:predicted RNA-binding Zn-ribbon protein involved in translation (DUF1610 family)
LTNNPTYVILNVSNEREELKMLEMISLEMVCPFCGQVHSVEVSETSYVMYKAGELAQNAFPYLSKVEREQIISHLCPDCQEVIFGGV